jgi:hypothetical protein
MVLPPPNKTILYWLGELGESIGMVSTRLKWTFVMCFLLLRIKKERPIHF